MKSNLPITKAVLSQGRSFHPSWKAGLHQTRWNLWSPSSTMQGSRSRWASGLICCPALSSPWGHPLPLNQGAELQALPLLAEKGMAQGCDRSREAVGLLPVSWGRSKPAAAVLCQVPADLGRSCYSFLSPLEPSPEVMLYHQTAVL